MENYLKDWTRLIVDQSNNFGELRIDNTEKDCVLLIFNEKDESNCVFIKRENIQLVIDQLERCKKEGKEKI
jgi:hypothetical protein